MYTRSSSCQRSSWSRHALWLEPAKLGPAGRGPAWGWGEGGFFGGGRGERFRFFWGGIFFFSKGGGGGGEKKGGVGGVWVVWRKRGGGDCGVWFGRGRGGGSNSAVPLAAGGDCRRRGGEKRRRGWIIPFFLFGRETKKDLADMINDGQYQTLLKAAREELGGFELSDGTVAFNSPAHIATLGGPS